MDMRKAFGLAAVFATTAWGTAASAGGAFEITSPAFGDNDLLASTYAAKGGPRECDGENVSPPLAWSGAPDGTASFAIIVHDAVGNHGLGVTHWIGYGIPASSSGLAEGAVSAPPMGGTYVGGTNRIGKPSYFGPCPDVGDVPHHYEFTLIATDLEPDALEAGLDRSGLLEALDGHAIAATSIVGRYARK